VQEHVHHFSQRVIGGRRDHTQSTIHIQGEVKFLYMRRLEMCFLNVGEQGAEANDISTLHFVTRAD
jgi:hypothetical protein